MNCTNCGTENPAGAKFCLECGARLAEACPTCGAARIEGAKFCPECGFRFATVAEADAAVVGPTARAKMPGAGVGPVVGAAPVAERRLVSVLFADLVGFTPFAEERDPEAVRELLTRYFDAARLAVERHGGTVEKFIGDAVMAVWGAPAAREDDAERAVRAALEIVDAAKGLGAGIEARAGVLTGETAVTLGASGQGMVAGDIVNTAARLQSVALAGTVLVGEATMHAASAAITFEPAGSQKLKGKAEPLPAWQALRVVAQRGGHGRAEAVEPPFVGREEELRLLKDALHATGREQRIRLISITGPAGIGKSRLAWELEKYLDGVVENVYWHRGRSPAYGEGVAFWALGEMVRRRAGLAETDDEATTRERLAATVSEYVGDAEDRRWVEPALLALLGLEGPPPGGRDALFAGWRIFFESIARRGTTILLFEDLQWADQGLLDFVDHLLDWSKGAPLLVITLARPELFEHRPGWGAGKRHFTALALEPLSQQAMRELLAGLVPGLPEAAIRSILARADGIPLYAVETVRMLVADGRLARSDDVYEPVGDLGVLSIPGTLRSLIAARLDALDPSDRALLQDASVLGRSFTPAALAALTGQAEPEVTPRLRALTRRELLELVADPRSPERGQYGFVQSLIQEVAYETLARRERRSRHLAAARYFEALGDEELAGILASHYLAAYETSDEGPEADALAAQARLALRGAAERAAGLGGHEQALSYLEQALTVTSDPAERGELLERAAASADAAARYASGIDHARGAIEAYRKAGDQTGAGRAIGLLGTVLIDGNNASEAARVLEEGLDELPHGDAYDEVRASLLAHLSRAGMRQMHLASQPLAIEAADRALALAEWLNLDEIVAEAFTNKGASLLFLGRRREAAVIQEAAVRLASAGGWIATQIRATNNLAAALQADDPRRSIETARSGVALGRRVGNRGLTAWIAGSLAFFSYRAGEDWDGALAVLDEILATATEPSERLRELSMAANIRIARGEAARPMLDELDRLATGIVDPQVLFSLEITRAEAALAAGDLAGSYAAAMRGLEINQSWPVAVVPIAIRSALWDGDPKRIRAAAERLTTVPYSDRDTLAHQMWATAAAATFAGRRSDALAGFHRALAALRDLRLDFEFARVALDVVITFGVHEPQIEAAADEARAIFERLDAKPYLAKLDTALAGAATISSRAAKAAATPSAGSREDGEVPEPVRSAE